MMARHVHMDLIGGLAGDMFLAASIHAGLLTLDELRNVIGRLNVEGTIGIETPEVRRGGITGLLLDLDLPEGSSRNFREIIQLLDGSDIPGNVRERTADLFRQLAEVEGRIHGVATDEVHFHELGALDSIVDFVGAAHVIEEADATWSVGSLRLGTGTVETAHGEMPVPAPATAELLRDFRVEQDSKKGELITPTGATILTHLRAQGLLRTRGWHGTLAGIGYGAGRRNPDGVSNMTRLMILKDLNTKSEATTGTAVDRVALLECDIDDRTPEELAHLTSRLLDAGAVDVTRTPIVMKKGRLGTRLTVLALPGEEAEIVSLIFDLGATLGVRVSEVLRRKLPRSVETVETEFGPVRIKVGYREGEPVRVDPEFEDCRMWAAERDVPLHQVIQAARRSAEKIVETLGTDR